ncbi:Flagellar transcriptional regulator FlhC [Hartmannibacter diazotrophicus]|uniref:Flagellar transcriptional regulator FlhC n=1 Tax=Hartmannibacter diazotrophicus TaxID=1482074 RepID=A0A2C9D266_9HYPH|nr:Flagellar transcriptional regulator FlhC [Hartmannibacter diazotrophicus]
MGLFANVRLGRQFSMPPGPESPIPFSNGWFSVLAYRLSAATFCCLVWAAVALLVFYVSV